VRGTVAVVSEGRWLVVSRPSVVAEALEKGYKEVFRWGRSGLLALVLQPYVQVRRGGAVSG
jgi:hypothetical protein